MKAIYVQLVFTILVAIGLGIYALIIGKSSSFFSEKIYIIALGNKNVESTPEGKVLILS